MRGYRDLPTELGRYKRASEQHPRAGAETMSTLCPGAFDGFAAFKPDPEPCADRTIDAATAKTGRVLSVVASGGAIGADAYGSSPMKVAVPGYLEGAEAYYPEKREGSG